MNHNTSNGCKEVSPSSLSESKNKTTCALMALINILTDSNNNIMDLTVISYWSTVIGQWSMVNV